MDSLPVKTAVVGVGSLGQWHARVLAQACPAARLVGVFDADAARAREIADRYHTRVLASLEEVAREAEAASVAVPTPLHFEVASFLLGCGLHLLVEKPLAATAEEAERLCQQARAHQRLLQVGHIERYNAALDALAAFPEPPLAIEAVRLAPYPPPRPGLPPRGTEVSVVHDLMIHDLELALSLTQAPLESAEGWTARYLSPTADVAQARLRFANGTLATFWASRTGPDRVRLWRLYYPEAVVVLDLQTPSARIARRQETAFVTEDIPLARRDALEAELNDFIAAIREGRNPTVPGESGVLALRAAEAILNAAAQGRPLCPPVPF